MNQISPIGIDTSKHIFQLHGVDNAEMPFLRRKLRRKDMIAQFEKLAPTRIANAADAQALCKAKSRPTMRLVPVKTADQQAALVLVGLRDRLVRNRTQLTNAIGGYAAEFGIVGVRGVARLPALLALIQADPALPELARRIASHAGSRIRPIAGQTRSCPSQAFGLASCRRAQPPSSPDPQHRSDRSGAANHEDTGTRSLPSGVAVRCLDRPSAEGPLHGRQGAPWRDDARRRRSAGGEARSGLVCLGTPHRPAQGCQACFR